MVKQGGVSWSQAYHSKPGVRNRIKCSICGRAYKMPYAKERYERLCKQYNEAREKKNG